MRAYVFVILCVRTLYADGWAFQGAGHSHSHVNCCRAGSLQTTRCCYEHEKHSNTLRARWTDEHEGPWCVYASAVSSHAISATEGRAFTPIAWASCTHPFALVRRVFIAFIECCLVCWCMQVSSSTSAVGPGCLLLLLVVVQRGACKHMLPLPQQLHQHLLKTCHTLLTGTGLLVGLKQQTETAAAWCQLQRCIAAQACVWQAMVWLLLLQQQLLLLLLLRHNLVTLQHL